MAVKKPGKRSGLSYLKDSTFMAVKRNAKSKQDM